MAWKWEGSVGENYPNFFALITSEKAILVCKDNYGKEMWRMDTNVKVPKKKPSEKKLRRLAGEAYSEYIQGVQTSAL
jgi:hypothetical protein